MIFKNKVFNLKMCSKSLPREQQFYSKGESASFRPDLNKIQIPFVSVSTFFRKFVNLQKKGMRDKVTEGISARKKSLPTFATL